MKLNWNFLGGGGVPSIGTTHSVIHLQLAVGLGDFQSF